MPPRHGDRDTVALHEAYTEKVLWAKLKAVGARWDALEKLWRVPFGSGHGTGGEGIEGIYLLIIVQEGRRKKEKTMDKAYYLSMRNKYIPAALKTVFVLESPPASGMYFYNEDGRVGEPLFSAMMKLLDLRALNKREGLELFAKTGHLLVDATYTPVNHLTDVERNAVILESVEELVADLKKFAETSTIELILVKANVCRLLESRLIARGFNVMNNGTVIPFPSTGQQTRFLREARKVLDGVNC